MPSTHWSLPSVVMGRGRNFEPTSAHIIRSSNRRVESVPPSAATAPSNLILISHGADLDSAEHLWSQRRMDS